MLQYPMEKSLKSKPFPNSLLDMYTWLLSLLPAQLEPTFMQAGAEDTLRFIQGILNEVPKFYLQHPAQKKRLIEAMAWTGHTHPSAEWCEWVRRHEPIDEEKDQFLCWDEHVFPLYDRHGHLDDPDQRLLFLIKHHPALPSDHPAITARLSKVASLGALETITQLNNADIIYTANWFTAMHALTSPRTVFLWFVQAVEDNPGDLETFQLLRVDQVYPAFRLLEAWHAPKQSSDAPPWARAIWYARHHPQQYQERADRNTLEPLSTPMSMAITCDDVMLAYDAWQLRPSVCVDLPPPASSLFSP